MRVTNRNNWPDAILKATENDEYNRGECDYTISELLSPPRILYLKRKYKDEIEVDVEDMIYALEGKILHKLLENANRTGLVEKRFFRKLNGYTISAQIDSLAWEIQGKNEKEKWILQDWKYTTRYKLQPKRIDADWEAQLNTQAWLLRGNDLKADELQIIGIAKDHSKIKADTDPKYFPKKAVSRVSIPMWSDTKVEEFISNQIAIHEASLRYCEPGEHWQWKRCAHYCSVNKWCSQWLDKKGEQNEV